MNDPFYLFSVVIPTYNRAIDLDRCLFSLVHQTYKNFEVIVCDNGSTDNTKEIIVKYEKLLNLNYLYNENSGGPAKPRNRGIKEANANWICFLDSDDWYLPNRMEVISNKISNKYDFFYHPLTTVRKGKEGYTIKLRQIDNKAPFLDLLYNLNTIITSAAVINKNIFANDMFFDENPKLRGVEDFDLWLRLAFNGCRFKLIKMSLGFYLFSENNFTQTNRVQIERLKAVYQPYFHFNIEKGLDVNKIKAAYSYLIAKIYVEINDLSNAISCFKYALIYGTRIIKLKALFFLLKIFYLKIKR